MYKHFMGISLPFWGFIIRGFIWDIPILIFAYVLFWGGPKSVDAVLSFREALEPNFVGFQS